MADKDITFYGDIKIDTTSASNSIASFTKQTEDLFKKTSEKMTRTLTSGLGFDFAKHLTGYTKGLEALGAIYTKHFESLQSQIRNPGPNASEAEIAWAKLVNEDVAKNLKKLKNSKFGAVVSLRKAMGRLAPYSGVYPGITALAKEIESGQIDSKKALGRYGYFGHDANALTGLLYRLKKVFPDIFTQDVLETSESFRDRNRISGIEARAEVRFDQKTAYRNKANQRALNYLWYNGALGTLNDIYDLGIFPTTTRTPPRNLIESTAVNENETWISAGMRADELRRSLARGGLSATDKRAQQKEYSAQMNKFIKGFEKAYPDLHETALSLKMLRQRVLGGNFLGVSNAVWAALGGKVASDIFHTAGDMLESYWGESITRNAYASRQAYLGRWTKGEKVIGSIIGGVLGGLVGGAAGAGVGYGAGGELLSLFGKYNETKYKADIKSSSDMLGRIRNQALWGSSYNTYFAKALTDIGIANGESAMSGLADKSMSFRGRMMLGQVGEQEMLYMSMMPNYYAALMAGITGPSLLNIYKRDLDAIGDPSMRYLVGQSIGNTEAFAAARSPYFNSIYSSTLGATSSAESALFGLQSGFVGGRLTAAMETLSRDVSEIFASARRGDKTIFNGDIDGHTAQVVKDFAQSWLKGGMLGWTLVNVIQLPDGTEIARDTKTADQIYANDLQLYTVGG